MATPRPQTRMNAGSDVLTVEASAENREEIWPENGQNWEGKQTDAQDKISRNRASRGVQGRHKKAGECSPA